MVSMVIFYVISNVSSALDVVLTTPYQKGKTNPSETWNCIYGCLYGEIPKRDVSNLNIIESLFYKNTTLAKFTAFPCLHYLLMP